MQPAPASTSAPLLVLMGPTASGKTRTALALASILDGEIVSADSMQVYRGLDIGTDKATPDQRARVPHHLVDIVDPGEDMDAAAWVRLADRAIRLIHGRHRTPLVVGGTGLYVRGLLKGFFSGPSRDPRVRRVLRNLARRKGEAWTWRFLRRLDPPSAESIDPADQVRIVRALEVVLDSGRARSARAIQWDRPADRYPSLKVALRRPRAVLHARIEARVEAMFRGGLLEEVKGLLAAGVDPRCNAFRAIGYPEAVAVLRGELERDEAVARVQAATRQYAKRQLTWLRSEPDLRWVDAEDDPGAVARAIARMYHQSFREGSTSSHNPGNRDE